VYVNVPVPLTHPDFIVAVTLAETDIAQAVSDKWISTGKDLFMSAGYSCYCWLLGSRKDEEFDKEKLYNLNISKKQLTEASWVSSAKISDVDLCFSHY
jgi:hypothetical protein